MASDAAGKIEKARVIDATHLVGHDDAGRWGRMPTSKFASSAQGLKADSALQPDSIGVEVQAHSDNLDDLAGVTPGTAGKSVLGIELDEDIRDFLSAIPRVATRTAMKALNPAKDTVCYLTQARRKGVFRWQEGDFTAEIAADPLEGVYVGAPGGAWVRDFDGDLQVQWWDAVGDGVANDQPAVQAMANFSSFSKVAGWLLGGVFLCSTALTLANNTVLRSDRSGTIKADANIPTGKLLKNVDDVGGNAGIRVKGVVLDLNGANQTGRQDMVQLTNCQLSSFTDNLIVNARWPHVVLDDCTLCQVEKNEIKDGIGHGVVLRSGTTNCDVIGNYIHDIGPFDGFDFGTGFLRAYGVFLYDGNCTDNRIEGNRIIAPNGHGIYFGGNGTNENYNRNKVRDNIIINAGARNTTPTHHGIWISFGAHNLVEGNTVNGAAVEGIKLNSEAHHNTIGRNHTFLCGRHGIALDDADWNTIEGNYSYNNSQTTANTGDGISIGPFAQCLRNTVRGNYCYDDQATHTQRYGIFETTAPLSDYNMVRDNVAWGNLNDAQISTRGAHTKSHRNMLTTAAGVELDTFTFTSTQTIQAGYKAVMVNITAARALTLPVDFTVPDDYEVTITDITGNLAMFNLTINASAGYTINGAASITLNQNFQTVRIAKVPGQKKYVVV